MALARALSRPFWTCNVCRAGYFRAFATSSTNDLPRQRRPWQDLAPYKPDSAAAPLYPIAEQELPAFENESFTEIADFGDLAHPGSASKNKQTIASKGSGKKLSRSDGISNLSNRVASQGLSIPIEFINEEDAEKTYEPQQREWEAPQERRAKNQRAPPGAPSDEPMSELPWYLQAQHQKPVPTEFDGPMAERQKLPELPIHPPQNFEPILQHLSDQIGLDYISILDLRKLDPPPALGNNLMMVIGTARGEKHLDVAADRFCAWLRKEYNFHPYADGLLGRNELKIKQRRKAKKARTLANAGASANSIEELDDGIRTGWICVHAGYLNPHPEAPLKEVKRINDMVGFGEENNQVTLVVQMFTEEKRNMVDLEPLWEGILKRNLRKQQHRADAEAEATAGAEEQMPIEEDDEGRLTAQELKARKKFKLGGNTVLGGLHAWEPQDTAHPEAQAV